MLYYGDNLPILRNRDYFPSESIDLVYLDPPFNSNQEYNVLFAEQDGSRSAAQIRAFSDTWRWDESARRTFDETIEGGGRAAEALGALRTLAGESDMLAYLSMMAPRLVELRRVLRSTGSLYLHCDPTAGAYLKVLLDGIFGPESFRNEIVWRRYGAHNDVGQGSRHFGRIHDTILFYTRGDAPTWTQLFTPLEGGYVESTYTHIEEGTGRRFATTPLTGPGGPEKGNPVFDWKGYTRAWRYSKATLEQLDRDGRLYYSKTGYVRQKLYLDESKGVPVQDIWNDIPSLSGAHGERLGFPTQKPQKLLERVIAASTRPGETVLDPFCGCGTAIAAAQALDRRWIGIDVTHLAITLIRARLAESYGGDVSYIVRGEPADQNGAEALARQDRYQFQWWALGRIGARPLNEERKKGADSGIDGKLFFREKENGPVKTMVIQVKSGALKLSEVRDFAQVIQREKAPIGVLLALDEPTRDMRTEAATLGYYRPEYRLSEDDKYDRYQILTIRELFEGKRPQYPPFRNVTFKAAPVAKPAPKGPKTRTKKLSET